MTILTITDDSTYQAALVRRIEITDELDWRYAESGYYGTSDCACAIRDLEVEDMALTKACIAYETSVLSLQHIW